MGHDIEIGDYDSTYISFNWSAFTPSIHQLHGHSGRVIARYLRKELDRLAQEGIVPNAEMGLDGWGNYLLDSPLLKHATMTEPSAWKDYQAGVPDVVLAMKCMHAFHMERFLTLALKYPSEYWFSDQVHEVTPLDGDEGVPQPDSDDDDDDDGTVLSSPPPSDTKGFIVPQAKTDMLPGLYGVSRGSGVVFSYIHPINGLCIVGTADDAMEAARVAIDANDLRAMSWTQLALIIKGLL